MNRRHFAQALAGFLSLAATPTEAQARAGGLRVESLRPDQVPDFLKRLEQDLDRLRFAPMDPMLARAADAGGLPPLFFGEYLAALALVDAFRKAPIEAREHPLFQRAILRRAPRFGWMAWRMQRFVEDAPVEHKRALKQVLDRRMLAELEAGLAEALSTQGIPPRKAEGLFSLLDNIAWRVQRQDPELFFEDIERHGRRLARRHGMSARVAADLTHEDTDSSDGPDEGLLDKEPGVLALYGLGAMGLAVVSIALGYILVLVGFEFAPLAILGLAMSIFAAALALAGILLLLLALGKAISGAFDNPVPA